MESILSRPFLKGGCKTVMPLLGGTQPKLPKDRAMLQKNTLICKEPRAGYHRKVFDGGVIALNGYLQQFANQDQKRGLARVYVPAEQQQITGYYPISYLTTLNQVVTLTRAG
ncbi:MAG: hypothetical protein PHO08_10980 [Methylococcales bacterium]|nr:hypothetical protein [Methylococcales bacterium]